jgi:hypothetical protein
MIPGTVDIAHGALEVDSIREGVVHNREEDATKDDDRIVHVGRIHLSIREERETVAVNAIQVTAITTTGDPLSENDSARSVWVS